VECSLPYTAGDFEAVARLALHNDPSNVDVLFAAAHLFEWAGKREESLARLNRTLLLSTKLQPYQIEYIASRIRSAQDIAAVIPARFPQTAFWSTRIQRDHRVLFQGAGPVFEKLQLAAIDDSLSEFRSAAVPPDIHRQRLLSLYDAAATQAVRRRLDTELATYSREMGDEQLSPYLMERSQFDAADVVDAALASDTRPSKSTLANWGTDADLCLDDFYSSIGFYIPQGEAPRLIELHGRRKELQFAPTVLKVFVSDDNQSWSELEGNIQVGSVQIGEGRIVAIRPHSRYYKYWKINFASSLRARNFCNSAQKMLRVYRSAAARSS